MGRSTALRFGLGAAAVLLTVTGCTAGPASDGYAKSIVDAGRFPVMDFDAEPAVSADKAAIDLARDVLLRAEDWNLGLDPDDGVESDTLQTARLDDECELEHLALPEGTPAAISRWYGHSGGQQADSDHQDDSGDYGVVSAVTVHHGPLSARIEFGYSRDAAERCGIYYLAEDLRVDGVERVAVPGAEGFDEVVAVHGVRVGRSPRGQAHLTRYLEAVARKGRVVVLVSAQTPYGYERSLTVPGTTVDEELRSRISDALALMSERLRVKGE
ncbi:hypothetical protein [Yinghuangia sp. YIM S09857]|uniref:hypothetical protein n=1 Tax=Yinghuangia sp. YIM S09857 TaxID=3436929 RepID=UPI003F53E36A